MEKLPTALLAVIAIAVCAIAWKVIMAPSPPTYGEIIALKDVSNEEQRMQAVQDILKRLPIVRIHSGTVDANVSGNVSVDE